jgi:recombinational DNA repair protein RecT
MSKNKSTAIQLLDANETRLKAVGLRKDLSYTDWRTSAMMLIESTDLRHCLDSEVGQRSLVYALTFAAITRLSLLPSLGYACIVPRRDKNGNTLATYQTEKAGLVKLASDAGYEIDSYRIYKNDRTTIQYGSSDSIVIIPALSDRGPIIGYAAKATWYDPLPGTQVVRVHYVDRLEVLKHAIKHASSLNVQRLLAQINTDNGIDNELDAIMANENIDWNLKNANWIKSFDGMGEKTAVRGLTQKPMFANILNIAANAEVAQEHIESYDTGVITVEVVNQGSANTRRELQAQKNQSKKLAAKNGKQQENDPSPDNVPPPETPW